MKAKARIDITRIAKKLGGERIGNVKAGGGYFGAMQVATEVQARFRAPKSGGRATDPNWTERRLVALAPQTLQRLEDLADQVSKKTHVSITPLQLAALLIEKTAEHMSESDAEELLRRRAAKR